MQSGWCVVVTKASCEEIAERALRERGYRCYLPRSAQRLRTTKAAETGEKQRRQEVVMRPAFRGYVFAELHPEQPWRCLTDSRQERGGARGVAAILCRGKGTADEYPKLLPSEMIEGLRDAENAGLFDQPANLRWRGVSRRRSDLKAGDAVRVSEGPFSGFLASLTSLDDEGRSEAILRMFDRDVAVRFDHETTASLEVAYA